jgi:hypothetical protein
MTKSTKPTLKFRSKAEIAKEQLEEKAARQQEYSDKVNALLKEGDCGLATVVQVGEVAVTLDRVILLPHQIMVIAN